MAIANTRKGQEDLGKVNLGNRKAIANARKAKVILARGI